MRYDLSQIMKKAWELFRKAAGDFSECLHRAWQAAKAAPVNAERIRQAAAAAGVEEEVKTWYGWKQAGYEVNHGSKALFAVRLIYAAKGDGATYSASFFGRSQVTALT